jgi:hypothetical protein
MKKLLSALFALTFASLACNASIPEALVGSGDIVTESFDVSDFDQIRLGTSGTLYVEQGDEFSLTIETDDNILPALNVDVTKGVLRLTANPDYTTLQSTTLIYRVTVPELTALDVSGSGEIFVGDLKSASLFMNVSGSGDMNFSNAEIDSLTINVNGSGKVTFESATSKDISINVNDSGDVTLAGTTESITITTSGSGKVFAEELKSANEDVTINGSGDTNLWVTKAITVNISGSGEVHYWGSPKIELKNNSGSGELTPLGEK